MEISIKQIKELLSNNITDDKNFKLKYKTDTVHLEYTTTNCDYFDMILKCKRKTYQCIVHVKDSDDKKYDLIEL